MTFSSGDTFSLTLAISLSFFLHPVGLISRWWWRTCTRRTNPHFDSRPRGQKGVNVRKGEASLILLNQGGDSCGIRTRNPSENPRLVLYMYSEIKIPLTLD